MPHTPVLLQEVLLFLDPRPGACIIDGTVDGGGHAAAILRRIMPQGRFIGIDWDAAMVSAARARFAEYARATFIHGNYADLPGVLSAAGGGESIRADGLLLDLGFSSNQLEASGRGFSFLRDEPLLMTYNDATPPVREILPRLAERELAEIIRRYGEERHAGKIAHAIVHARGNKRIRTTGALAAAIWDAVPPSYRRAAIHPATRTFQALRIYVNRELENLEAALAALSRVLAPAGGRAVIITFHSLEDRIVKRQFQKYAKEGTATLLAKKPVTSSREEQKENPRSRSAKLRAIRFHTTS